MVDPDLIEVYNFDNEYESINIKETHEVLGGMTMLLNKNNEYKEMSALNTFRFGYFINKGNHGLTIEQLSEIFYLDKNELMSISKTVNDLGNDEQLFKRKYKESGDFLTWNQFLSRFYEKDDIIEPLDSVRKLGDLIKIILDHLKEGREYLGYNLLELYASLFYIRNIISRYLPPDNTIADVNYLKYYDCCCCGESNVPENGYDLKELAGIKYIKYPICSECLKKNNPPNLLKISQMYSSYSILLEEYLNRV